jgi:hypothetical protein
MFCIVNELVVTYYDARLAGNFQAIFLFENKVSREKGETNVPQNRANPIQHKFFKFFGMKNCMHIFTLDPISPFHSPRVSSWRNCCDLTPLEVRYNYIAYGLQSIRLHADYPVSHDFLQAACSTSSQVPPCSGGPAHSIKPEDYPTKLLFVALADNVAHRHSGCV